MNPDPAPESGPLPIGRQALPLARYRLEWRATAPIRLPDYAGSMLRGAFGHALRQVSCMTKQTDCRGCPLLGTCPYPAIFAPPPPSRHSLQQFSAIPAPYVIEPPPWGAHVIQPNAALVFHIVLIGRGLAELPLILLAWRRALARGIGPGDGRAELERVVHCGEESEREIHRPNQGTLLRHDATVAVPMADRDGLDTTVRLNFHTPLRLQENGRALPPSRLCARVLLMALVRRTSLLSEFHGQGHAPCDFAALRRDCEGLTETRRLQWQDWTRFSSRQQQAMALGGVVGTWDLHGRMGSFLPFLKLGQWLHVGKEAVFGLGAYTWQTDPPDHTSAEAASRRDCAPYAIELKPEIS